MNSLKRIAKTLLMAVILISIISCRQTVKTVDPNAEVRYGAEYGYSDLQNLSKEMATRILASPVAKKPTPPVMLIFGIENRTDEHVDMKALANAIRNQLINSGKFQFINEAAREKLEKEMAYQNQGFITPESKISFGKQIGAELILTGQLVSITADQAKQVRVKKKELKYYRLTLEITDINTNIIAWTDEQEIVREESRPFVGW